MRVEAVIFDFDGVVVDSLSAHLSAWDAAAHVLFQQVIPEELRRTLPGRSTHAIAAMVAAHFGKPALSSVLADKKRAVLTEHKPEILLLPGAREVMEHLTKTKVPFGIASNAPRAFVHTTVATHQLKVPVALGVEDVARPKPAPDLFLSCANRLGIGHTRHSSVVVFEDSLHGLNAARDAGMYPVGLTTQHSPDELTGAGAKTTFANLLEALNTGFFVE